MLKVEVITVLSEAVGRYGDRVSADLVRRTVRASAQARCMDVAPSTVLGPIVIGNEVAVFASLACHVRQ